MNSTVVSYAYDPRMRWQVPGSMKNHGGDWATRLNANQYMLLCVPYIAHN